jgi:hypothetical protein
MYFVQQGRQNFPAIKELHKNSRCRNFHTEYPQILHTTICNSVAPSTWRPEWVQPLFMKLPEAHLLSLPQWPTYCISGSYILISCYSEVVLFKFWIKENLFCKRNCLDIQAVITIWNAAARTQINRGYKRSALCIKLLQIFPHAFAYHHYTTCNTQRALSLEDA